MKLKAYGKFIDSTAICNMLVQGEKNADIIRFEVDRYYNGSDMSELIFIMRGINSLNQLAEQVMEKQITSDTIILKWNVDIQFTSAYGELCLEIRGITDSEIDTEENIVIKYTIPSINIRKSSAENLPEPDVIQNTLDIIHSAQQSVQNIYNSVCNISVRTPIIKNGIWWTYDSEQGKYIDTGVSAYDSSRIFTYNADVSDVTVTLKNNTEFRYINSGIENLVINPGNDYEEENFISSVVFRASASGLNINFDFEFEYIYDVLLPWAGKQYCMMFFNDGFGIKCAWYEV